MRRRRVGLAVVVVLLLAAGLGWRYQSQLIGLGLRWYLGRMAADGARDGSLAERRAMVVNMNRALLMPPPPDALVGELFDLLTLLGQRMASGSVPPAWGAYIYSGYVRDLEQKRAGGRPPRTLEQVRGALDREVRFYAIRQRPGEGGVRVRDLLGAGSDGYTADEIEQAAREGRQLPLH